MFNGPCRGRGKTKVTKTNAQINIQNEALVVTIVKYFFASKPSRGKRLLNGFLFLRTSQENALFRNWSISIQINNWVIRRFSNKLFISFNLDFWKIMKLLLLLLLCVLILARSARSPSFDVRLHGSSTIARFVESGLFIKTFCH